MTGPQSGQRSGYERFEGGSLHEDEPVLLPISLPAEELQHLTGDDDSAGQHVDGRASTLLTVTRFLWQGGSAGDAWLHMTAAQVELVYSSLSIVKVAPGGDV